MKKNLLTFLGIFTLFSLASIFCLTSTGTLARLLDSTSATVNLSLESGSVSLDLDKPVEESGWVYRGKDKDVYFEDNQFKNVKNGDIFEKTITITYHGKNTGYVKITPQLSDQLIKDWNTFSGPISYKSEVTFGDNKKNILDTTGTYNSENKPPKLKSVTGKISNNQVICITITMSVLKSESLNFSTDMMPKYIVDVQNDLMKSENLRK